MAEFNYWHCPLIGADMGYEPHRLSSIALHRGATARAGCKFVPSRLLATIVLFTASAVSANAQTNWTGAFSNGWFNPQNWDAGVPTAATSANIDTVTPNSTEVRGAGATALNLTVGQTGTGMLVIQNGGTLTDFGGFVGNLPGSQGTVIVSGAGSTSWSAAWAWVRLPSKTAVR
jgi:T5SS/PEP-CTERM-associated repeat protein